MMLLKDLPKYETLLKHAERYPEVDPKGTEAFLYLLRTSSDILEVFCDFMEEFDMSQGRFTVLILLNRHVLNGVTTGPLTPAELADRAGVTRATMTGLLDGLEEDGYLTRTGQLEDRRRVSVELTPKAHTLLQQMLPLYFRRVAKLMKNLDDQERETLMRLMHKMRDGLPAVAAE